MFLQSVILFSLLNANPSVAAIKPSILPANKNLAVLNINDWTRDFIGQRTFELMHDPIYAEQFQNLKNLEAELLRTRGILNDKKKALDQTLLTKQNKVTELQTTNKSLEEKNKLKTDSEKEQKLLETQNESLTNSISSNTNLITAQNDEVQKLTQEFNFWKGEFDNAVASVSAKEAQVEAAKTNCQNTQAPGTDCTQDKEVIFARELLNQAVQRRNYLETQKNAVEARLATANGKISQARKDIADAETKKAANSKKIEETKNLIARLTTEIPTLIEKERELTAQIKELTAQEVVLVDDVKRITSIEQSQGFSFQAAVNNFDKLKTDLINQILSFNRAGYDQSVQDGAQEGIEIANNLGGNLGTSQGQAEGLRKGEADGRARDFEIGARQGEGDGSRDGKVEGAKAGTLEGKQAGFKAAGVKEGEASGIQKAINSDAASVGANLGRQAGMQRAINSGSEQGRKKGEAEAIQANENQSLQNISINGNFAGTFQQGLPGFPGTTGKYFNNVSNNPRKVLREAFSAGYNVGYSASAERVYYDNIQAIYKQSYDQAFRTSYDLAFAKTYEDSIRQGRGQQYAAAFEREYKIAHANTYKVSFDQAINNPDRSGSIFINAFKTQEADSYNKKYAEIKERSFQVAELDTYNQNVGAQIEKARVERVAQVNSLYNKFPVLKFISSSIKEIGTKNVGAEDGFFMPGEDVVHSLTIANYGAVSAPGAKVVLRSGEVFSLPSLPANSLVTIVGAAKEKISATAKIGEKLVTSLSTKFNLSAQEKNIQGRHFANPSDGTLNSNDQKSITVDYPIAVSELKLVESLVLGKAINVKTTLINRSQKDFSSLKLELDSSLAGSISQGFSDVGLIDQTISKSDAIIEVKDAEAIFKDVAISLVVKVNDVIIGKSAQSSRDFVRVPFKDVAGQPVVVLNSNSESSRESFKDIAAELGGVEKVGVVDLNAFRENQAIVDSKLSGKTVLVIESSDSVIAKLGTLLRNGNVFVGILGEGSQEGSIAKARQLISSTLLPLEIERGERLKVLSSTPLLSSDIKEKVTVVEFKLRDLDTILKIAPVLKLSDEKLLQKMTSTLTKESFLAKAESDVILSKILALRVFEEAAQISMGLSQAEKNKEKKVWKKKQKKDQSLLVNVLENKLEKGSREEKNALSLAAITVQAAVEKLINDESPFEKMEKKIKKATLKAVKSYEKCAQKNLGKSTKEAIKDIAESFFPVR